MRTLTPSEKRLSLLLGASLFFAANLIGFSAYLRHAKLLKTEIAELRNQQIETEVWLDEEPLWRQRADWLASNQPARPQATDPSSDLLEEIQKSAGAHQLQILDQGLQDPSAQPGYYEVAVRLRLGGPLENLVGWLADLQKPGRFFAIPTFTLRSDKEPPNVICDLVVARWHSPPSP